MHKVHGIGEEGNEIGHVHPFTSTLYTVNKETFALIFCRYTGHDHSSGLKTKVKVKGYG